MQRAAENAPFDQLTAVMHIDQALKAVLIQLILPNALRAFRSLWSRLLIA